MALSSVNQISQVLSQPCEVQWAGFRTNTFLLQKYGWRIAAEQDFHRCKIRLVLNHPDMDLYGISDFSEHDFFYQTHYGNRPPVFNISKVVPRIEVLKIVDDFSAFKQIDATPQYINREVKGIEDFGIFAMPLSQSEEIIVEPATVYSLLEQIRAMQSPEQAKIRERNRRRERDEVQPVRIHANIISLDDVRQAA